MEKFKKRHPPYKLNLLTATRLSLFKKLKFSSTSIFKPPPYSTASSIPIADVSSSSDTLIYTFDSSIRFHVLKKQKSENTPYSISTKTSNDSNKCPSFYAHEHKPVTCLHYSKKNMLASGGRDGSVCLSKNAKVIRRFKTNTSFVTNVRIHPTNENLITSTCASALQVWDASYGACVRALCRSEYVVLPIDLYLHLWRSLPLVYYCIYILLTRNNTTRMLRITTHSTRIISYLQKITPTLTSYLQKITLQYNKYRYTPVTSDFNPIHPTSLLEGSDNGDIVLWDMRSANVSMLIEGAHGSCGGGVLDVAFSSTGFLMISGGADGNMCVWDTRYVKDNSIACLHRETRVHNGYPVRRVKFCGDCSTILVTSSPGDRVVRVWDLQSKVESVCHFKAEGRVRSLALSPDGRCLFTGTECGKMSSWSLCVE